MSFQRAGFNVLVAVTLLSSCSPAALADSFSELVVFGDSHSDVGHWGSRASDDTNWIDSLALQLDLPITTPRRVGGLNFAVGGARTGPGVDNSGGAQIPQMGHQIASYLADDTPRDDQLFTMLIGHNDFGWGNAQSVDGPLDQFSDHLQTVLDAGVNTILVANVPPLSELPAYRGTARGQVLHGLVREFNERQRLLLDDLRASRDVDVFHVDFFAAVTEMINRPADFGMTDVTRRASSVAGSDPDEYLHWDDHHYTSAGYHVLGQRAAEALPSYLKPKKSPLIEKADRWLYLQGTQEPSPFPELAWTTPGFDDVDWKNGSEGFGYGRANDIENVQTVLNDMRDAYGTLYLRHQFSVVNSQSLHSLKLQIDYDDAFVAYINGVEVARAGVGMAGGAVPFDGQADRSREARFRDVFEIDLAEFPGLINVGDANVLAIQGINRMPSNSDFVVAQLRLDGILLHGDFNGNAMLDLSDIEALSNVVQLGTDDNMFDIDEDGSVDLRDHAIWVKKLSRTFFGDANLDGEFNSGDLVAVFTAGQYEDDIDGNSTWSTGDWDANGDFTTGDLVAAFQDGGYEPGPRASSNAVPEPTSIVMLLAGLLGFGMLARHDGR